jgi:PHD/YefM family antitoxin component YafN of YafNO toxin-antitoxin module
MPITTLSSREFNQDRSRAKKAAKKGPVYITDRGRPTFVLLNIEDYNKITHQEKNIIELLAMPEGTPAFDFDFEELRSISAPREVNFD